MEIFTGAECPPCVAADVAFDALLKTYKPTEFIGLQHHLHIPGPDPLTNTDTVARQGYYGSEVRGTPSTFFNGKSARWRRAMANSRGKYDDYRKVIDPALDTEKQAEITLTATQSGDEVKIAATAKAASGDAAKGAKPKLRLVLIEPAVRYPGSNKLRFHNNVVRAFPEGSRARRWRRARRASRPRSASPNSARPRTPTSPSTPRPTGASLPQPAPADGTARPRRRRAGPGRRRPQRLARRPGPGQGRSP